MKINEYLAERNQAAKIAYSSGDAEATFDNAAKGKTGQDFNVRAELKKVHDRYDAEVVDDFKDFNNKTSDGTTDGEMSLLS